MPCAAVALWHQDGTILRDASLGDGPVDAVFKAIERITGVEVVLKDYRVRSVSVGEDAQGEASVEAQFAGRSITGRAVSTDIIEASALAFLQVINRIVLRSKMAGDRVIRATEAPPREPAEEEAVAAAH
jgi:2-isopropylmalate synthase